MALDFEQTNSQRVTNGSSRCGAPTAYPLTCVGLVYPESFVEYGSILHNGRDGALGYQFTLSQIGGRVSFYNNSAIENDAGVVGITGEWNLVAVACTSATSRLFYRWAYKSLLEASGNGAATSLTLSGANQQRYTVGAGRSSSDAFWDFLDGTLAWCGVYNIALSLAQLQAMRYLGPFAVGTPVNFCYLDEGNGTTTYEFFTKGALAMGGTTNPAWAPYAQGSMFRSSSRRQTIFVGGAPPPGVPRFKTLLGVGP